MEESYTDLSSYNEDERESSGRNFKYFTGALLSGAIILNSMKRQLEN